jgi:hypothetical protein
MGGINELIVTDNYVHDWVGEGINVYSSFPNTTNDDPAITCLDNRYERNRIFLDSVSDTVFDQMYMGIALWGGARLDLGDATAGALIANNIVTGCRFTATEHSWLSSFSTSCRLKMTLQTDLADRPKIYNNTFHGNYAGIYAIGAGAVTGDAISYDAKNNIISAPQTGGYFVIQSDEPNVEVISDYNCYHGTGKWKWDGGTDQTTLSGWQSVSSQDAHSITGDPLLNADYSLQGGSPCIDAGTDTDLTDDFAGNARPNGGGYDIGAYEYTLVEVVSRPSGDVTTGSWVAVPSGSLYAKLDEATPDDADYIYTRSSASACEMTLSALTPPGGAASYTFSYRGRGLYTVYLKQGAGTTIAAWAENDSAYTTHDRTLTPGQAALITDPSTLRVRIVSG